MLEIDRAVHFVKFLSSIGNVSNLTISFSNEYCQEVVCTSNNLARDHS